MMKEEEKYLREYLPNIKKLVFDDLKFVLYFNPKKVSRTPSHPIILTRITHTVFWLGSQSFPRYSKRLQKTHKP